jgi:hypothetical protein
LLFDARQQWRLAAVWARRAKTLPPLARDRMLKRARFLAHMASWQWQHPNDSRTAKAPCSPETLRLLLIEGVLPQAWGGDLIAIIVD